MKHDNGLPKLEHPFSEPQANYCSTLTLFWSMPNWKMSDLRKNMSAHYMHGYRIWAADNWSCSPRPITWQHFIILRSLFLQVIFITSGQYSDALELISSEDHKNLTFPYRSMLTAFQISIKYCPIIFLFSSSHQTHQKQTRSKNTSHSPSSNPHDESFCIFNLLPLINLLLAWGECVTLLLKIIKNNSKSEV